MNRATALMPLPRHNRSQVLGVTVVDDAVVVDGLMMISSRTEGEGAETLQDLVDPVHRSVRASFTKTDGDDAIQEGVWFRRGLEPGQRSKVVAMTQPLQSPVDHLMT